MGRLALLLGLIIVAIIAAADTSNLGPLYQAYDFPHGDKVGHFVLFGSLALVTCLALLRLRPDDPPDRVALAAIVVLGIVAAAEEFTQIWIATRKPDLLDLLTAYAGMSLAACLAVQLQKPPPWGVSRRVL